MATPHLQIRRPGCAPRAGVCSPGRWTARGGGRTCRERGCECRAVPPVPQFPPGVLSTHLVMPSLPGDLLLPCSSPPVFPGVSPSPGASLSLGPSSLSQYPQSPCPHTPRIPNTPISFSAPLPADSHRGLLTSPFPRSAPVPPDIPVSRRVPAVPLTRPAPRRR